MGINPAANARNPTPAAKLERVNLFLLFLFFIVQFVFVLVVITADARQFKRLDADYLVLASTLFAGDRVAFLNFIYLDVKIIFAFWAGRHDSLLSLYGFDVSRFGTTIPY